MPRWARRGARCDGRSRDEVNALPPIRAWWKRLHRTEAPIPQPPHCHSQHPRLRRALDLERDDVGRRLRRLMCSSGPFLDCIGSSEDGTSHGSSADVPSASVEALRALTDSIGIRSDAWNAGAAPTSVVEAADLHAMGGGAELVRDRAGGGGSQGAPSHVHGLHEREGSVRPGPCSVVAECRRVVDAGAGRPLGCQHGRGAGPLGQVPGGLCPCRPLRACRPDWRGAWRHELGFRDARAEASGGDSGPFPVTAIAFPRL